MSIPKQKIGGLWSKASKLITVYSVILAYLYAQIAQAQPQSYDNRIIGSSCILKLNIQIICSLGL